MQLSCNTYGKKNESQTHRIRVTRPDTKGLIQQLRLAPFSFFSASNAMRPGTGIL